MPHRACVVPAALQTAEPAAAGTLDDQLTARLLQQRIILLHLEFASPDAEIALYINSPGGSRRRSRGRDRRALRSLCACPEVAFQVLP